MANPFTDVIILTYNGIENTKKCIPNLFSHTKNFNLILVDNGSTDGTQDYIKQLSRLESNVKFIQNTSNRGVAGGRNDGLKASKSDYCVCLDNDQYVGENWLNDLFFFLEKGFDTCGVDAWQMNMPNHFRPYFPKKHCLSKYDIPDYVGGGGHLIPRHIFEKYDFFDEKYMPFYYEDTDFYFKLARDGLKTFWNCKHNIQHQEHSSRSNFNKAEQFRKSYKLFVDTWMPFFPRPLKQVCDIDKFLEL